MLAIVSVIGVFYSAVLALIMIISHVFCFCCAVVCGISIVISGFTFLHLQFYYTQNRFSKVFTSIKKICTHQYDRFNAMLIISVTVLSVLCTASISALLHYRALSQTAEESLLNQRIQSFQSDKPLKVNFPKSVISRGDVKAKIRFSVFSDPFCSACISFLTTEKQILSDFPQGVVFDHYFFPLDIKCNSSVKRKIHENSCVVSEIVYGAALAEKSDIFWDSFIEDYRVVDEKLSAGVDQTDIMSEMFGTEFAEQVILHGKNLAAADEYIARDILFGQTLNVRKTPTVFLNGKKLDSPYTVDFFERVIRELGK